MTETSRFTPLSVLSYLHGSPIAKGAIRQCPEDFYVEEQLSFEPSGAGEHLFLWIEKRESNTEWVAKQLAKHYGVRPGRVAWAGLKDRNAVTRQWFGVHLPGLKAVGEYPQSEGFVVLEHTFNDRKLRVGAIASNFFRLRMTNLEADTAELEARLQQIKAGGVPNYFGEQRFGHDGNNLKLADNLLLNGKRLRKADQSMAISAARSYVFNQMLSARIQQGGFAQVWPGDALMLNNSKSVFLVQDDEMESSQRRLEQGDCHISCVLPGGGKSLPTQEAAQWEADILAGHQAWIESLERLRVNGARRAARVLPQDMNWSIKADELELSFHLPTGAYATSVLREFMAWSQGEYG